MIGAIITLIVVFSMGIVSNLHTERRKKQLAIKLAKDTQLSADMLGKVLQGMEGKLQETLMAIKNNTPKGGASRVYAVILQRGFETRLFVHPANTFEAMAETALREFGNGWTIVASAHSDVLADPIPLATMPIEMGKPEEAVKPNVANYINNLKYARDNFADEPSQKKAIEKIISNIEKHYGRSNSTTS